MTSRLSATCCFYLYFLWWADKGTRLIPSNDFFHSRWQSPVPVTRTWGYFSDLFSEALKSQGFSPPMQKYPAQQSTNGTFLPPGPDHFTFFFLTCVNKTGRGEYYSQKQVNLWKCTNIRNPQYYCSRAMETIWCLSKHSPTTWCYKCLDDGSIWQAPKSSKLD